MTTNFSTIGGQVTRGETYTKLMFHVREAQDCAAILSHLSNTEDSAADRLHAQGWLGIEELFKRLAHQLTALATRSLQ